MATAVKELDFETAAVLRDEIVFLKDKISKEEKQARKEAKQQEKLENPES